MDELLIFGAIVLMFVPIAGALLGLIAFFQVQGVRRQRAQFAAEREWLIQQVSWLQTAVAQLQQELRSRPAVGEAAPVEEAAPEQTLTDEPAGATEADTAEPVAPVEPEWHTAGPLGEEPAAEAGGEPAIDAEMPEQWAAYAAAEQPSPAEPVEKRSIAWEQLLGIRGAAILGGIVLALAALLFVRYAIESGWLTPGLRIAMGAMAGLGCLGASLRLRQKDYAITGNSLAGSGIVALYASVWAAHTLYAFVSTAPAFGLMILVTALCAALAWLHRSPVTASLGLVGGFLTPLLINSGEDNPIGLFGYLLLLNVGMLALGQTRRWPWLTPAGLVFTFAYEAFWLGAGMTAATALIGVVVVGVFGLLFLAAATRRGGEQGKANGVVSQLSATLVPFALALYFAGRTELDIGLGPLAGLLAVLAVACCVLSRQAAFGALPVGAAGGSLAVVGVWALTRPLDGLDGWLLAGTAVLLSAIFAVFVQVREDAPAAGAPAAALAELGFLFLCAVAAGRDSVDALWPWLAGFALLTVLAYRTAVALGYGWVRLAAGLLVGLGLTVFVNAHAGDEAFPGTVAFGLVAIGFTAALWAAARWLYEAAERDAAYRGAFAASLLVVLGMLPFTESGPFSSPEYLLIVGAVALCGLASAGGLAAGGIGAGAAFAAMAAALGLSHAAHGYEVAFNAGTEGGLGFALAMLSVSAAVVTFWPLLAARGLLSSRIALTAAALAPAVWFYPLHELHAALWGTGAIGLLPAALALLAYLALQYARGLEWPAEAYCRHAVIWLALVCVCLAAVAIPLQFDKEWITIGWALQGLALLLLWLRIDHPGLKYAGLALLSFVSMRLLLNEEVLRYHGADGWPVFNWLLYTYLVPAGALFASAFVLHRVEAQRAWPAEAALYSSGRAWGAMLCAAAGILVAFWWVNLAISQAYETGPTLTFSLERMPARDLTRSVAWALFAVALLVAGIRRSSRALRWASLAGLVLTIGKVFLSDLGELEDLYRVASLVGLAFSLLGVSVVYQRFVFGRERAEKEIPASS